jgi:hypothetical protein
MLSRGRRRRRWAASGDGWVGVGRGGALLLLLLVLFAVCLAICSESGLVWSGLEYYWIYTFASSFIRDDGRRRLVSEHMSV